PRRHSDHGERSRIQSDGLPDHAAVGPEPIRPKAIADHSDVVPARLCILIGEKEAACDGMQPQNVEIIRADQLTGDLLRFPAAAPSERYWHEADDTVEYLILTRVVAAIRIRHA